MIDYIYASVWSKMKKFYLHLKSENFNILISLLPDDIIKTS